MSDAEDLAIRALNKRLELLATVVVLCTSIVAIALFSVVFLVAREIQIHATGGYYALLTAAPAAIVAMLVMIRGSSLVLRAVRRVLAPRWCTSLAARHGVHPDRLDEALALRS